jgi:hypothetical protein
LIKRERERERERESERERERVLAGAGKDTACLQHTYRFPPCAFVSGQMI